VIGEVPPSWPTRTIHESLPFATAEKMLCESLEKRRELMPSYSLIVIFRVSLVRILIKVISFDNHGVRPRQRQGQTTSAGRNTGAGYIFLRLGPRWVSNSCRKFHGEFMGRQFPERGGAGVVDNQLPDSFLIRKANMRAGGLSSVPSCPLVMDIA
jgi:hypothetical protein